MGDELGIKPARPIIIQYQCTQAIAVVFEHAGSWWWTSNYEDDTVYGPHEKDVAIEEAESFVFCTI